MKQAIKLGGGVEVVAVGVDLGDRWSQWCALGGDGEVVGRGRVASTAEAVRKQAEAWHGARVAIENGTHSGWFQRALTAAGCVVTVANPSRWRGTAHSAKNDANDAEALARVVRVDPRLLFPIHHRSEQAQQDLAVIRSRAQLVKTRSLLINTVRGTVKSLGHRLPSADAQYFCGRTWEQVPCARRWLPSTRPCAPSPSRSAPSMLRSSSSPAAGTRRPRACAVSPASAP